MIERLTPVQESDARSEIKPDAPEVPEYICDRCGAIMSELNCKIVCGNCGNRFDCSDLNLYFD